MATSDEIRDARSDAHLAILQEIKERVEGAPSHMLVQLAEAWAWMANPSQSHGGGAAPKTS